MFFVFAWYAKWPTTLWIHSLPSTEALQNDYKPRLIVFKTRTPTSCQICENLLMGDWLILCGREQAVQGPTRTSQRIAARQSSTAKKIFSRTLKCYLRWSWDRDPEDSKSKAMVQARECQANGEPSLVVGRGRIIWTMLSLMALTRQKQLAKLRQAASQPASQCWVCHS